MNETCSWPSSLAAARAQVSIALAHSLFPRKKSENHTTLNGVVAYDQADSGQMMQDTTAGISVLLDHREANNA